MVFFRQVYWSGLSCSPPGGLLDPEIEPVSPASPAIAGGFFTTVPPVCLFVCLGRGGVANIFINNGSNFMRINYSYG